MRNLKQTELQRPKTEDRKAEVRRENDRSRRRTKKKLQEEKKRSSEIEDLEKEHLATLKILNRGDENKLERNLDWRMWSLANSSGCR